jgi:hypothetical protein
MASPARDRYQKNACIDHNIQRLVLFGRGDAEARTQPTPRTRSRVCTRVTVETARVPTILCAIIQQRQLKKWNLKPTLAHPAQMNRQSFSAHAASQKVFTVRIFIALHSENKSTVGPYV